ncbi:MAG: nucleotidyltransferase domain-containing protein [Acidobacteriales bacterium]|nr:nucleotidyltransferase domain-containing protein [Terriglobales bacterium]
MTRIIQDHRAELEALCRKYGVVRLELFGSAAREGTGKVPEDLDFLAVFKAPDEPGYANRYFGLQEALANLFGLPVDLVDEGVLKNPYFMAEVDKDRVLLYGA